MLVGKAKLGILDACACNNTYTKEKVYMLKI